VRAEHSQVLGLLLVLLLLQPANLLQWGVQQLALQVALVAWR
jgi:hypothetical protein